MEIYENTLPVCYLNKLKKSGIVRYDKVLLQRVRSRPSSHWREYFEMGVSKSKIKAAHGMRQRNNASLEIIHLQIT